MVIERLPDQKGKAKDALLWIPIHVQLMFTIENPYILLCRIKRYISFNNNNFKVTIISIILSKNINLSTTFKSIINKYYHDL